MQPSVLLTTQHSHLLLQSFCISNLLCKARRSCSNWITTYPFLAPSQQNDVIFFGSREVFAPVFVPKKSLTKSGWENKLDQQEPLGHVPERISTTYV